MTGTHLRQMTTDELVERFATIGVAQDVAILNDNHAEYNRLYGQMDAIDRELRARGPDARRGLLRLCNHPNLQVKLKAATRTLAVAPTTARKTLDNIRASRIYPQAADAGMLIRGLDDGSFRPD